MLRSVLTCDASISINVSIRSLCASEDSRDISISISRLSSYAYACVASEDQALTNNCFGFASHGFMIGLKKLEPLN